MASAMGLFDVHAHLTSARFVEDLDQVIERARSRNVSTIVCNGLNVQDNKKVLQLSEQYPEVRPALGLYPVDAVLTEMIALGVDYPRDDADQVSAEETLSWLKDHVDQAFAIGEIGLDHHWVPETLWQRQEEIFRKLVELSMEADLPAIIHTRKAERLSLEILEELGATRVNFHCFSSRLKLARRIAEAGYYLSIPANARRSETFTKMLDSVPRTQLLLETDCPYLGKQPGERSEPADVVETCQYAAEVWKTSPEQAGAQFEENFERLFRCAP